MTKERGYRAYAGACVDLTNEATNDEARSTFWLRPKRGSAWLIVFSGQFLKPTLVRCTQRFEQSLGGCLRVAALQGLVAIRLLDPLARQAARSMTALNPVGGSLRAER
jgi:hypothetical protein